MQLKCVRVRVRVCRHLVNPMVAQPAAHQVCALSLR